MQKQCDTCGSLLDQAGLCYRCKPTVEKKSSVCASCNQYYGTMHAVGSYQYCCDCVDQAIRNQDEMSYNNLLVYQKACKDETDILKKQIEKLKEENFQLKFFDDYGKTYKRATARRRNTKVQKRVVRKTKVQSKVENI